ncbi:MAG: transposase [Parachlamydiaceae bacterium]|nr:transposase [Parachlamydiaceae bacterium]
MDKTKNTLPSIREFDGHDWFSTKTSRRNLPHWELKGSTYFITMNVNSLIDKPFKIHELAALMEKTLKQYHKDKYLLQAYVIMPDHLHLIIKPLENNTLAKIMQLLKGSSAYSINKCLERTDKFWQQENFDHLIRDGISLCEKWEYIKNNPVKARLVGRAEDYPYSSFYDKS